ncbi:MAG: metallophosphoesterase [Candidatus Magnetobacterium sp. LHC-1]|uniref:Metallophosphoesterase n=1 Tax=Candidatus Magnetobacterium casense TaxID=1455061 RepID=A0ABS6RTZ2_9BACT|nr:metallophosphoesterase [Candidatus Magnetobacterium casensis]MBF0608104.1 metallophosphoesterase [Nitrospirota bacterium]MBV6340100.1 metallophosphoesterase [Candidatus Magnetobacterium casensis]
MTRRKFLINGLRAGVVLLGTKGVYNTSRYNIEIGRITLVVADLPSSFDGFKIALLSDIHSSAIVSEGLISRSADMCMAEAPDVIALTGDFITGTNEVGGSGKVEMEKDARQYIQRCVNALSTLRAPAGIYGVLGNHDFWSGQEAVDSICRLFTDRIGVVWLRNKSVRIKRPAQPANSREQTDQSIYILGVDDHWESSCSLTNACKGIDIQAVKVLLSHNPDINIDIESSRKKIDVVLSGHTHGGQIVFPFIGAPFLPSTSGQKYISGVVRDGARQTYITTGVGNNMVPMRYNCPPEVALITLRSS